MDQSDSPELSADFASNHMALGGLATELEADSGAGNGPHPPTGGRPSSSHPVTRRTLAQGGPAMTQWKAVLRQADGIAPGGTSQGPHGEYITQMLFTENGYLSPKDVVVRTLSLRRRFTTSFDTHIAGQHTGEDAEAKDVEKKKKKKKGRNKISPWEDGPVLAFYHMSNPAFFDELIHSSRARTVIDLCPGSGEALASICAPIPCMGQLPIPFMGPRTGRRSRVEQQPFSIRCKQPLRVSNHLP